MKFYFVATSIGAIKLLRKEKVKNILVSIAHWRRKFESIPPGLNLVIDSGAYTNVLQNAKNKVSLEEYEHHRDNELCKCKSCIDYVIMFDDATSRANTISNWERHVQKGHDDAAFVDHIPFFNLQRSDVEAIYKSVDRVALSLPDTAVEAKQRTGAKARSMKQADLFEKLMVTTELARKYNTKTHLLAVMRPAIITKFKFDALDTAVWINGSKYGNCFIYRRTPDGKVKGHWAQYHSPRFKEFLKDRFSKISLDYRDAQDRDRFNVRSLLAYEKYVSGNPKALAIIRKNFEFEELSTRTVVDFGANGDYDPEFAKMSGRFPALKMPDPEFNVSRLREGKPTGLLSRVDRSARIGVDQALVNEKLKAGGDQFVFGIVKLGKGTKAAGLGDLGKDVVEGLDSLTKREFQGERSLYYYPFELVREFKKPLELKTAVPGRRFASPIDLERDVEKEKEDAPKQDIAPELRFFSVSEDRLVPVQDGIELRDPTAPAPEFVVVMPGSVRPWVQFPLDSGIQHQALEQAAHMVSSRRADLGVVAKRVGDMMDGSPVYSAITKLEPKINGVEQIDEMIEAQPGELKEMSDENLKKAYAFAHEFYATHFAGNDSETVDGLTREDVVNSYTFVVREMKRRGVTVTPKDELDSAARDLDADLFKQTKAGRYQTSVDEGHRHIVVVDEQGNGETSVDNEHSHEVKNWKVLESHDHIHVLQDLEDRNPKIKDVDKRGGVGVPQKCKYCKEPATKAIIWANGHAYIPVCDEHVQKARDKIKEQHDAIDEIRDLPQKSDTKEMAETHPSGNESGRTIKLKEVLDKLKAFRFRQDAIIIVGGLANNGETKNDIDILIKGPLDEATRHVLQFRIGRMLGPELSKRIQFLEDELGGPFTNHVPLGNLMFEMNSDFVVKEMRAEDIEKQGDPLQDLPSREVKMPAVFQLHTRGKSVHGDLRLQVADYLIGWTLNLQKAGAVTKPITAVSEAKALASGYSAADGNRFLKPLLAPKAVAAEAKSRQPLAWLGIGNRVFEPGEVGATRNHPAVFVQVDRPKVEFGRQSPRFHEYFFTDGRILNGIFNVRQLISEDEAEGGTPEGKPFWRAFLSKDFLPSILKKRTAEKGVMPPDGFSWLPKSLRQDVPEEFRYWNKKGAEAKKMRDALVESRIFTDSTVGLKNGQIRLLKKPVAKAVETVDYTLSRQGFRGPVQVRSGFTRSFWWLVLDQSGSGVRAWKLQTDPTSGEKRITAIHAPNNLTGNKDLLDLKGDQKPGTKFNDTKVTPSDVSILGKGKVELLDAKSGFLKMRFKSGPIKGIRVLKVEEVGSQIWEFAQAAMPGEPMDKAKVPTQDGVQIWNPDEKDPDLDRTQLKPLAIYAPMKPTEGFFKPDEVLRWATPEVLRGGVFVEPKWNGWRAEVEAADGDTLIFFEDTKKDKSPILPTVAKELRRIEEKVGPFVIDAEFLDFDDDGNVMPRRTLARFGGNTVQEDKNVRFKVFHVLFSGKKNHTATPLSDVRKVLKSLLAKFDSPMFDMTEAKLVNGEEELGDALSWAAKIPGSEGAMLKMEGSTYTLGRLTDSWAKLKLVRPVKAIVLEKIPKKPGPAQRSPSKTFVYVGGVGPLSEDDAKITSDVVEMNGKKWAKIGRTFATNVQADKGDTIEVEFTELLVDDSPERKRIRWFTPIVTGRVSGKPATLDAAMKLALEHEIKKMVDKFLEKRLPIIKGEEGDKRIVYGVVLEPETIDAQNDIYSVEEIETAAHQFMEEFRHLGVMHKMRLDGRLKILETYIAPSDLTINGEKVKKGTWMMAIRVLDDTLWKAIKAGKLTGFSIAGSAIRKPEEVEVA